MQVGIFLRQSLRQRLLVPASVPAAVNPELGFGDVALTAPPRLVPKPRLPEARTECRGLESGAPTQIRTWRAIARLCPANSRPPTHFYILRSGSADKAARAWHDGPKRCVGIGRNQVAVGEKIGPNSLIHSGPSFTGIGGAEYSNRRDSNPHPVGVRRIRNDAVEAQAAQTRLPLTAGRVFRQAGNLIPCGPVIVASRQCRRGNSQINRTRLLSSSRLHVPNLVYPVGDAADKTGRVFRRQPGGSKIVATLHCRSPNRLLDRCEDGPTVSKVVGNVVHLARWTI